MGSFWVCNIWTCGWGGSHFAANDYAKGLTNQLTQAIGTITLATQIKRDTFGAGLLLVIVDLRGEDLSVEVQLDFVIAKGHLTNQGNSINVRCEKVEFASSGVAWHTYDDAVC